MFCYQCCWMYCGGYKVCQLVHVPSVLLGADSEAAAGDDRDAAGNDNKTGTGDGEQSDHCHYQDKHCAGEA